MDFWNKRYIQGLDLFISKKWKLNLSTHILIGWTNDRLKAIKQKWLYKKMRIALFQHQIACYIWHIVLCYDEFVVSFHRPDLLTYRGLLGGLGGRDPSYCVRINCLVVMNCLSSKNHETFVKSNQFDSLARRGHCFHFALNVI